MPDNQKVIYRFGQYAPDIYADDKGSFFTSEGKSLKKQYNNGSLCIAVGKKKYSIIQLRKKAIKTSSLPLINENSVPESR